jgi:hypothetical protein
MGMDAPNALQPSGARSKTSQIWDNDTVIVADNHVFNVAPPSDEEGNLFIDVI